ncbi:MAG: hypothetical protein KUG65_01815 [Sphingomonadaceae bacterium]|nr:hypothetical protein [Sphingomonadaceae bacterium]
MFRNLGIAMAFMACAACSQDQSANPLSGESAFENVANLDRLPAKGALVIALPAKIERGIGAPLRVVAMLPGD